MYGIAKGHGWHLGPAPDLIDALVWYMMYLLPPGSAPTNQKMLFRRRVSMRRFTSADWNWCFATHIICFLLFAVALAQLCAILSKCQLRKC